MLEMVILLSHKKNKVFFLSLCGLSAAYPSVNGRYQQLKKSPEVDLKPIIFDLGWNLLKSRISILKALGTIIFAFSSIILILRTLAIRKSTIFLGYPASLLAPIIRKITRKNNIIIDAFISLYDTIVYDRSLVQEDSLIAKYIFAWEKRIYVSANLAITDTTQNSEYYKKLFSLSSSKFQDIPLPIAPFQSTQATDYNSIHVFFLGTFVPLQGVDIIFSAIKILQERKDIIFTIIGYGQTATQCESIYNALNRKPIWIKEWQDEVTIAKHLNKADICLGIFGNTQKTERVWPIKNYYYFAAGKATITKDTPAARSILKNNHQNCLLLNECTPEKLAQAILMLADNRSERESLAKQALLACYPLSLESTTSTFINAIFNINNKQKKKP